MLLEARIVVMKKEESKTADTPYSPQFKSYSVDKIMAAGGPLAFANKMGKDTGHIFEELAKLPSDAFLTEEEFNNAINTLKAGK